MKIALQMDPPERLNYRLDSSLCLAREAARRGHTLYYLPPTSVSQKGSDIYGTLATFKPDLEEASVRYALEVPQVVNLSDLDLVLIRQDPPFDMAYISNLLLLETLEKKGVRVLNRPHAVRSHIEKLIPLLYPEFTPPTLISSDITQIREFYKEQGEVVIKPLYAYGGKGVFKLNQTGENAEALLEMMLSNSKEPLVVQRFLKEVYAEEKRILLVNGKVVGAFQRIPATGEIRANTRVGGGFAKTELTPHQKLMTEAIGDFAKHEGLMLVGMDVIGDWLTEVNITSPTGLMLMKEIYGHATVEKQFWDAVEA